MAHINESLINIQFTLNLADTPALTHAYSLSYLLNGGGGGGVGGCSGNVQGNNSIRVATIRSLQNKPPLDRGALPPPIEDFFLSERRIAAFYASIGAGANGWESRKAIEFNG